jgi:hypothetical protein
MNDEQYLEHARELFNDFANTLVTRTQHLPAEDPLRCLATAFQELSDNSDQLYADAPGLVNRLFTTWPDFAPTFPRELLWFFGGDCLHFMPDDEIALYQQLDELRARAAASGELFDLRKARANLLKLQ